MRAPAATLRVGLDAQLTLGTATGIGEYVAGLAAALRDAGCSPTMLAEPRLDPWRFDRRVCWDQVALPLAAARAGIDVLHCTAGTMPLVASVPIVATVHDVAWFRVQAHTRSYARAYFGSFALARYASARTVFVDSSFSRDELLTIARLDENCVEVLYPGVAADIMDVARTPDAAPFVLAVGTVEVRKNLETLVRALAAIPQLRLIAVGPFTPYRAQVLAVARECGVEGRVELRGYVTRTELLALYARATVAALPSRYEGFGYGAAQALCAGVPLIAADSSSLPEVVAGAAPLVAPDDVDGWIEALRAVLADRDRAEQVATSGRPLARERFAWSAGARIALRAYRRAARA